MDVVVVDVPAKYGMLLSRSWGAKLGGSLQLDMTYAMIPIFDGNFSRLYRETRLAYTVSDPHNPNNYPIYFTNKDLGNFILSNDDGFNECTEENCIEEENKKIEKTNKNVNSTRVWKMFFDGASSWEGVGVRVLCVAPGDEFIIPFSYRL
jgi:hypothetical protein